MARVRLFIRGGVDLATVLGMGQTFLWRPGRGGFFGTIQGRAVFLRQVDTETLEASASLPPEELSALVSRYFDAERDLEEVRRLLSEDPHCRRAVERFSGLRVLRQPFWECLAGFLLSSANNVRRIHRIVRKLAERYGEVQPVEGELQAVFPPPERLVDIPLEALYDCGTGFRARGLREAARRVASGEWDGDVLARLSEEEARARLMSGYGIGEKIADCVLLYALGFLEVFPLDVWMRRVLKELYFPDGRLPRRAERARWVRRRFPGVGGYAQLYLYHAARHGVLLDRAKLV
ncbi:MAG: 8-oxoguanine DNA glycosylase [Candidatus Poribacteria bacterium]|nr:MAG: 8-oxoguanine DNA glycosylase [Candidatus Poribacteria bacterium]